MTTNVDGVYINTAVAPYTFTDIIEYVRDNIHKWENSALVWDLTQFPLSRDVESGDKISDQLAQSMEQARKRSGKRTAFVVPRDYEFGMFRMYCIWTECLNFPFKMRAFRSMAEAQAWVRGDA